LSCMANEEGAAPWPWTVASIYVSVR